MNKKTMYKIILAASLLMAIFCINLPGQEDQCPKFRIAVSFDEIYEPDSTVARLNKKYNKNLTAGEWINEIESKIFEELNNANYDNLEFFSPKSNPDGDADFRFLFSLMPWSVDKDETIPAYEVKYIDPVTGWEVTEYRAPRYNQEPAYRMTSRLSNCSTCFPLLSYYLSVEIAVDIDIYQLIKNLIHFYNWPLDKTIRDWEEKHPAPARKPEMEIENEKEFLSLLDAESRKMEVRIKVKNCHGEYVYEQSHSQPVYFEKETERLQSKNSIRCYNGPDKGNFRTIMTNKDYEAVCEYSIKCGLEPVKERVKFLTCGIGTNSVIETENDIIIRGLELLVEPWRKTIHNGEQTTTSIDLHETDPDGNKYPVENKEVQIKVTGLVDGTISPSGKVTTDDMGVAWIDYKAGQEDKQIKIEAIFTPPGYPEKVKGDATINVKPLEYDATLTIRGSYKKTERNSYREESSTGVSDGTWELQENREASFYVPLKFENAYDVAIQNQRWEFYRPLDINLSTFNASLYSRKYDYGDGSGQGFRTTVIVNKSPSGQKVSAKNYLLQSNITLIIDKTTDKVVKIATGGFGVEFTWNETDQMNSESWWPPPPYPGHDTKSNTETRSEDVTFNAQPVEDHIPDPTYKSVSESVKKYMKDLGNPFPANIEIPEEKEEIPEVEPDLLVKSGDGKTFFGGKGKKIIDNSDGPFSSREELNFSWQVTRRKKK